MDRSRSLSSVRPADWEAAAFLEKLFESVLDALRFNIVIDGRIVINSDGKKIFIANILHYNDNCNRSLVLCMEDLQ